MKTNSYFEVRCARCRYVVDYDGDTERGYRCPACCSVKVHHVWHEDPQVMADFRERMRVT